MKTCRSIIMLVAVLALASCTFAETARFPFSFANGVNEREDPGALPAGWAAVGTYNVDFGRDGSARKRTGYALDEHIASGDTVINGLFMLRNARSYFPRSWGLAVAGSKWQKRHPTTGTYTALTAPSLLKLPLDGTLTAVDFDGELIGGGDASAVWHFDGTNLNRMLFSVPWDSLAGTADTTAGGSLVASTEYLYYWTYGTRLGYESYAAGPIIDTTSATAKTITLSDLPRYPDSFTNTTDTAQIAWRFIYRTSADASGYLARIPVSTTSYIDAGSLVLDEEVNFPAQRQPVTRGKYLGTYHDQLWTTGPGAVGVTGLVVNEAIAVDELDWTYAPTISDVAANRTFWRTVVECNVNYLPYAPSATLTALSTTGKYRLDSDNAYFRANGVSVGDYAVAYVATGQCDQVNTYASVVAVLSDTSIILDRNLGDLATEANPTVISVGGNIFRVDNEIFGVAYATSNAFRVGSGDPELPSTHLARGLFGTSIATHASGTPIYRIDPRVPVADQSAESYDSYDAAKVLWRSERFDAIRQNTQEPTFLPEEPTGVFRGNGFLGIVARNNVHQVRDVSSGDEVVASVSPMIEGVGSLAPGVVVPYKGGAFVLDERGVYHVGQDGASYLSGALGDSIRGRTSAGYYAKAAGAAHDGKLYVSVPRAASWTCDTWVADLTRESGEGPVWTRYTGPNPRCFATLEDANDETQLFYGAGDTANVYRFDRTLKTDAGADIASDLVTPYVGADGGPWKFEYAYLPIDKTGTETTTVYVDVVTINNAGTQAVTRKTLTTDTPITTNVAGRPRLYRFNIGIEGTQCRLVVSTTGSGTLIVHPGAIFASPQPL